jgi:acetyltransferase
MSVRNLKKLFRPQSVAIIGASNAPGTVGAITMRNLLQGGFKGPIMPVNPKYQAIQGVLAYKDVNDLPLVPDLAVLCVPPDELPGVIGRLGERGCPSALIITSSLDLYPNPEAETSLSAQVLSIAQSHGMRLLGPASLGVMVPGIGLNASFAASPAKAGRVAFVSQSGAISAAVLDWAAPKGIGFSHFISLGGALETDFGDVLDYLGSDPDTRAILLYIESIDERRNFMSAARAAARNKPVLAIKAGRNAEGARAAQSHTGQMAGSDLVYDAAMRRAGMLRVYDIEELFAAVETLSVTTRPKGERLAILTNGGGVAVMAVDELVDLGGSVAVLKDETIAKLETVLPPGWSQGNPIDIMGDASGNRYADALNVLVEAREIDSILVMHTPVAVASASEIADQVIALARKHKRTNITTCWVGEQLVASSRAAFHEAGLPTFDTPRQAVQAFMHTVEYRRNQELLMETPDSLPSEFTANTAIARMVVENAISQGRTVLSEPEAKAILSAYGIPTVETHIARTPEECRQIAQEMGGPLALKILSPDLSHKSDRGGVRLNIETADECLEAAEKMLRRLAEAAPDARLEGFTVQRMERRPGAHELIVGVATDPIFGPVILFGQGGTAVEVIGDRAVALPPLNLALGTELISRTRVSKLLQGYRSHAPADQEAICLTLIQVAQMIVDIPEIIELDINPLFADEHGVVALDARMAVRPTTLKSGADRMAIRPYPRELEQTFIMKGGRSCLLRPIRPEDEPNHHVLVSRLTPEDIRFRFFGLVQQLPHSQMARMTQIDYDREMAFIATAPDAEGNEETLGVVRAVTDPDNEETEFSIVVRSDLKGSGLAREMMKKMIRYCRERKTMTMVGQVLKENGRMLHFVESLGFRKVRTVDIDVVEVELDLQGELPFT